MNEIEHKNKFIDRVITLLTDTDDAMQLVDISKSFGLKSDTTEYEELKDVLNMLVQEKVIKKNTRRRYSIARPEFDSRIIGILTIKGKSMFVEPEKPGLPIVFINNNNTNTALAGDKVAVQLIKSHKKEKKLKGEIVDILDRNVDEIVGKIEFHNNNFYLIPDNKEIEIDFLISQKLLNNAKNGDKVVAKLVSWNKPNKIPTAKVIKVLEKDIVINDYNQIIKEFNLPTAFPDAVVNEANKFKAPQDIKIKDRLDLRNEKIITIDPATARDFDDALSLTKLENGNYYLGVHIADVSYYVKENSELDKEAEKRGNSIYLIDRVIPMLPENLSNDICSLNPNVARYTFSVMLEINDNLEIVNYVVTPSIIKSCKRFTYNEVQDIIDTKEGDEKELVLELNSLANKFRENRIASGSINYDTKEVKYILDEKLCPVGVDVHQTTESTALVEEFMLLANKQVTLHLETISKQYNFTELLPFIYRIHDAPKEDALNSAFEQLKSLGIKFKTTNNIPETLNNILERVKNTAKNDVVNQILIRSMPKAVYSAVNIGHFGLNFKNYTHFTSPIRRYADLIVHRLLREYVANIPSVKRINQLRRYLIYITEHISDTERMAMEAERASTKLTSAIYAKTLVGETFEGSVSGVQSYGIFVILDDIYVEGFISRNDLPKGNYDFDEKKSKLSSKKSKQTYSFGTRVKARILKVNVDKRQIDLVIEK
jgi:ribonuclease R